MNKHTPQSILEKIQKENIKPTARWYFVVRHAALWVPGALVTLLGAHAVAGLLYASQHSGWEYREFVYRTEKDFLLEVVPLIWIVSLIFFSLLIVKALRTTSFGYRFSLRNILGGGFLLSILLGGFIYSMNEMFETDSVIRYPVHAREQHVWGSPEVGRLAGVIEKKEAGSIDLRDKNNIVWEIDMSGFGTSTFPFVEEGKSVRIIGTSTNTTGEEHSFIACAVFPWELGGFNRGPLPPAKPRTRPPQMMLPQNKNPDCVGILKDMRDRFKRSERK